MEPPKYGATKERLFRTLLQPVKEPRTWYRIAKDAHASYGWADHVLRELEEAKLVGKGRVLKPLQIFERWAKTGKPPKVAEFLVQDPDRLFASPTLSYAWTTYWAENLVQKQLFPRRLDFYTSSQDWDAWRKRLAKEGLIGGGNVRVILGDENILNTGQVLRDRRLVSTPQLIVDLLREGGVCREPAELLVKRTYGTR
jgi:hypothetical protein